MRVELKTEGGIGSFPGLAGPFVCESASLTPEEAKRLADLVEGSGLLASTPGDARPAPLLRRGADRRLYLLAIEEGAARCAVALEDPLPAAVAPLVAFVRDKQRQHGR